MSSEEWKDRWDQIQAWHRRTLNPIQVIAGTSADATAAVHILLELLRAHLVLFEVHPVTRAVDIAAAVRQARASMGYSVTDGSTDAEEDPLVEERLFLLIGCGANVDLTTIFNLRTMIVHVLDSYRPFSLGSLRAHGSRLLIWGAPAIIAGASDLLLKLGKRLRSADDLDEPEPGEDEAVRTRWLVDPTVVPARVEAAYYATLASGRSVACELYDLAIAINHPREPFLWDAAVGVTDLLMRRLSDGGSYNSELSRLYEDIKGYRLQREAALADITNRAGSAQVPSAASEQFTLRFAKEYRATVLLRHWCLWSALWHQTDVANALELRQDRGEGTLQAVLAVCGVSRRDAEKPWSSISSEERARLLPLLQRTLEEVVPHFTIPTIARAVGYSTEVSAFDAVRLHNALLAAPVPSSVLSAGGDVPNEPNRPVAEAVQAALAAFHREQYWQAMSVLTANPHSKEFKSALREAQSLLQGVALGVSALLTQRGAIVSTSKLHYSVVGDRVSQAVESFWTPPRLGALAEALASALNYRRRAAGRPPSPLLLACAIPPQVHGQPASGGASDGARFLVSLAHEQTVRAKAYRLMPFLRHVLAGAGRLSPAAAAADAAGGEYLAKGSDYITMDSVQDDWLVVKGRDNANHFVESIHLASLNH